MKVIRSILAALALAALAAAPALAQSGYVQYGQVSTSNPTGFVNGTYQPLSLDLNGNLRTVVTGGITIGALSQGTPGASAWLTTDAADGPVAPGAVAAKSLLVGGTFNSVAPTLTNGQQAGLQVDSSGRLIVNIGSGGGTGGTSSNFAAAFPGVGTAIGMSQGGNMVALTGTTGNLNVNCASGCSAASDTSNGSVGAGTAGTTSKLVGGVFNTVAPTLTNGQQVARQVDSAGNGLVNLKTPIPTGSNVIGQVGGTTVSVSVTPTISVAAYSAGACVGGLMTFSNAARSGGPGSGLVQSAVITDASGQDAAIDLVLFSANPSNSTFTDHSACAVAAADLSKVVGVVAVSDCHLLGTSAPGACQGQQQALPFSLGGGNTTLWGVNIARGTPTYTAANNIIDRLLVLED